MGVLNVLRRGSLSAEVERAVEPRSAACLNCDTPLAGPYCSACGQRDIPPYPSVRELAVDAFWELSGWDGRFAATARALVRHPGMLTREFLEGRRARYISPLRLYLVASLAYFLVAASAPNLNVSSSIAVGNGNAPTGAVSRPARVAVAAESSLQNADALTEEQKAAALRDVARAPAVMQPFLRRIIQDPVGFRRDLLEAMPRMLFALLPVFAVIVALFYRGRKYPEHFYFAIHLHAFVFVALAIAELTKFTRSTALVSTAGLLAVLTIPVYSTLAFRRVYGGSMAGTLAREIGIGALYALVSGVAFVVTIYVVSVMGA
jgi:hypothetical protein